MRSERRPIGSLASAIHGPVSDQAARIDVTKPEDLIPMSTRSHVGLREAALAKLLEAKSFLAVDGTLPSGNEDRFESAMTGFRKLDAEARAAGGQRSADGADTTIEGALRWYTGQPAAGITFDPPRGAHVAGGEHGIPFAGGSSASSWINGGPSLGQAFIDERARSHSIHHGSGGFQAALLETGSTAVAVPLRSEPIEDPRQARFVFELLTEEPAPGGMFSYLKQTTRDLNAAVVATGAKKPVSTFKLERVNDSTKVIAHVTDPIDRFVVEDAPLLRRFLDDELKLGLNLALDARVVNALLAEATQGEDPLDLAGIRTAITTLQLIEMTPTAIVVEPTDWQSIEEEAAATFAANDGMPVPTDPMARRLYGVPVVVSTGMPAGAALVGSFDDSALLYRTGGIRIDVSDAPPRVVDAVTLSGFQLNEVTFRAELRAEIAIGRPTGFVVVGSPGS